MLSPKARALWSNRSITRGRISCLSLPEDNLPARRAILPSQVLSEGTKPAILTFRCPAPGGTVTLKLDSPTLFFTVSRKNYVLDKRVHQSAAQQQAECLQQAIGNTSGKSGSEVSPLCCVQRCGGFNQPFGQGELGVLQNFLVGLCQPRKAETWVCRYDLCTVSPTSWYVLPGDYR